MKNMKLTFAILAIAIIWGTSFLGIRLAVETIPPLYVAGIRHVLSAIILGIYLSFTGKLKWIGWENLKVQLILSTCILIITNGLTTIAEEHVSSSLASLISSCSPILIFIGSVLFRMQQFTLKSVLGILLGFSGIILIFWDGLADLANPILLSLFYQFVFAGVVQIISALVLGEEFAPETWSLKSVIAMFSLTIFASIIAYLAYIYALSQISAVKVSMVSYVNTIIAIFLGWLIADEPVDSNFIIAAFLIILGIFITNYHPDMFKTKKH